MRRNTVWLISYTDQGGILCRKAGTVLEEAGYSCRYLNRPRGNAWMKEAWEQAGTLLFVCAAGIAVRMAAPYIKDKLEDPALLVMDERGRFVIPLVSSHAGGGGKLALFLGEKLGACPVLTTATDTEGLFAVDVFARENALVTGERELVKHISATLLKGEKVGFFSELPVEGKVPEELIWCRSRAELEACSLGILVSQKGRQEALPQKPGRILVLSPRNVAVGMGCKKGVPLERVRAFYREVLEQAGVDARQVTGLFSIDLKKEEPALCGLAREEGIPYRTFPAKELSRIEAVSEESDFVRQTVGVGNVCERAALLGCRYDETGRTSGCGQPEAETGPGMLLVPRKKKEGMTAALAVTERSVRFG